MPLFSSIKNRPIISITCNKWRQLVEHLIIGPAVHSLSIIFLTSVVFDIEIKAYRVPTGEKIITDTAF